MENSWNYGVKLWICLAVSSCLTLSEAGISYQSVSFVHSPPKIHQYHSLPPLPAPSFTGVPKFPSVKFYENHLRDSFGDELWPASIFEEPVEFLDITLNEPGHLLSEHHQHEHDFINELELPPDPYLLTGYQAKQVANYLYSHELFFKDIPHAKALLKLQEKRRANGLRPNRLGSLNVRSPFNRDLPY